MTKMQILRFGVFSPFTLMLHTDATGEPPGRFLKRAAVLFESLVFVPLGLGNMGEPDEIISKDEYLSAFIHDEPQSLKAYLALFFLDRDLVSDVESFHRRLYEHEPDDLWGGEQGDKYIKFVENLVKGEAGDRIITDPFIKDWFEASKYFIGNIHADYKLFKVINRDFPDCSGLFTEIHEAAVQATFAAKVRSPQKVIETVADLNAFDFADLSWEDIFELRNSDFASDFRGKIAEWIMLYSSFPGSSTFEKDLNVFIEEAKFKLIGATAPNLRKTILSAIGGNLPSPIGVNPVSLFSSINTVRKEHDLQKRFGPGFPFCLPLMARLYTRSPPIAQKLRSSHNRSASKAFI